MLIKTLNHVVLFRFLITGGGGAEEEGEARERKRHLSYKHEMTGLHFRARFVRSTSKERTTVIHAS